MSHQWKTLTVDGDSDFLLFALSSAGDAACVEAPVWALELGDGQNAVEQHVHVVFHEPFGRGAGVVGLKVKSEEDNTEDSPMPFEWN